MAKKKSNSRPVRKSEDRSQSEATESAARSMDLAVSIAAKVRILAVVLADCVAKRTPDADMNDTALRISIDTGDIEIGSQKGDKTFYVKIPFVLRAHRDEEMENERTVDSEPQLSVCASFALFYELPGSLDEYSRESLQEFANINSVFNAWPYWREFVQNTTARMGLPPITIPVFRL